MEKWDLTKLYDSEEKFENDIKKARAEILEPLSKLEGKLGTEEGLVQYLTLSIEADKLLSRLAEFASMRSDLDKKNVANASALAKVELLFNDFGAKVSYADPEILALGKEYIDAFFKKHPELNEFDFYFEKLFRDQDHVLSAKEERLMSNFSQLTGLGGSLYASLSISDYAPGKVKLSNGEEVEVNHSNWTNIVESLDKQDDRRLVFESLYSDFEKYAKLDSLSDLERYKLYSDIYQKGRSYVASMVNKFGKIDSRPTDRRENYVKRCVGLPGQTLQIKNHIIYLDGKPNKEPENVQYSYKVKLNVSFIPDELQKELGISGEDQAQLSRLGYMPLTKHAYEVLKSRKDLVAAIAPYTEDKRDFIYPLNGHYGWTRDNYGPIWIPKKGESVKLTLKNLPIYERPIKVYEGNDLQVNDKGEILINGKVATSYTFKLDYYWMQGDNRHNSADSRYWGFVPEDHIVGKPIFIWWSSDPDRRGFGGIRWSRLFTFVENYN